LRARLALPYLGSMKTLLRALAALVAVGLAVTLVPVPAIGDENCVTKCKAAEAACNAACEANRVACIGKCGGPPPVGNQKCNDGCASTRADCGNACHVAELACEGKCALPVPVPVPMP